jgi:hypothetical protein
MDVTTEQGPGPAETEDFEERRVPVRSWAIPAIGIVAVIGLVAVALSRGPTTFDPTTPEGAVQEYLLAVSQGQWEQAFNILDPDSFDGCEPSDIAAAGQQSFTAVHESTDANDINATVLVRLRFGEMGLFGSGYESTEQFSLIESDGFWYITQDPWPYFRWSCEQL